MIVHEDGMGLENAESFCSVAFANTYFKNRGADVDWIKLSNERKEQLLRIATEYIELRFGEKFKGSRLTETQALSFPRTPGPALPVNLLRATAEYALRARTGPLLPDPVTDERGQQVKSKDKKLGPLEERVEYSESRRVVFKPYPAADMLLKSLLRTAQLIR